MKNSTVLVISGLVFVMGYNEPSPTHTRKCMFFVESLSPHPFWDFYFQGEIYHIIIKIMCNCKLQNVDYYYLNMSIHSPRRLTNYPDSRRSCHQGTLSLIMDNHKISSNDISSGK